jgi:hypothetical protein
MVDWAVNQGDKDLELQLAIDALCFFWIFDF